MSTSTTPDLQLPTNVEFQLQLDVMVAVLKVDKKSLTGYTDPDQVYIRPNGKPVSPPNAIFTYTPPELASVDIPLMETPAVYVGWTLRSIALALHEAGLTTDWSCPVRKMVSWRPLPNSQLDHNAIWTLSVGPRELRETQEPEFDWVSVRVVSPLFGSTNRANAAHQLNKVLHVLNTNFITFAHASSRLQILVRPTNFDISLSYLKQLASLLWVIDPLLSEIHPPHCGPGSLPALGLQFTHLAQKESFLDLNVQAASADIIQDPWNYRLSADRMPLSVLKSPGNLSEMKFSHGLGMIKRATTMTALLELLAVVPAEHEALDTLQGAAYDFSRLGESSGRTHGMMCFNQHSGTLDYEAILYWTVLCTHLVALSADGSPNFDGVLKSLQKHIRDNGSCLAQALGENSLQNIATYYQKRKGEPQMLDEEHWPILRNALAGDNSEPSLNQHSQLLRHSNVLQPQDPSLETHMLSDIGETIDKWHKSSLPCDSDSRYTFGIEIEMLLPLLDDHLAAAEGTTRNPQPSDPRRVLCGSLADRCQQVAEILESLGVAAHSDQAGSVAERRLMQLERKRYMRNKRLLPSSFNLDYQVWLVEPDGSLTEFYDWKGYDELVGIELASPIYRDTPECWGTILDTVSGLRQNMRIAMDDSCGFHVSVGAGNYDLSFPFLGKLVCATFLADPIIFSLCDPKRKIVNKFSQSLREESNLAHSFDDEWRKYPVLSDFAQHLPVDDLSVDDCAMFKKIWLTGDFEDLTALIHFHEGHRSALSFNRVLPRNENEPSPQEFHGAVEFRYLQGTLDPELILRFCQLMVALFKFVDTAEPEAFREFSSNLVKCKDTWNYDLTILQRFLEHLNLGEDYMYWESVVNENRLLAPSIKEKKKWYQEAVWDDQKLAENLKLVEVIPSITADQVESLRREICLRKNPNACTKQELGNLTPAAIAIDGTTDLRNRTQATLQGIERVGNVANASLEALITNSQATMGTSTESLKNRLSKLDNSHEAPETTDRETLSVTDLVKIGLDAFNAEGSAGLFAAIDRYGKVVEAPESIELSTEELNALIDPDETHVVNSSFMFGDFTYVEGDILDINLSEEELKRFLLC